MKKNDFPIRQVNLDAVLSLLSLIFEHDGLSWTEIQHLRDVDPSFRSVGSKKKFSRSRMYHHLVVLRCMGLVEGDAQRRYHVNPDHRNEVTMAIAGKEDKAQLLLKGCFRCSPILNFLSMFTDYRKPRNLDDFIQWSKPIRLLEDKRNYVKIKTSKGDIVELEDEPNVNLVRWGAFSICRDLEIIDELRIPIDVGVSEEECHSIFPTISGKSIAIEEFKDIVVRRLRSRKDASMSIPTLIYLLCITEKLRVGVVRELIGSLASRYGSDFYFDRMPLISAEGYMESYITIEGEIRSTIRYIGEG
jgi:hypothetical protein